MYLRPEMEGSQPSALSSSAVPIPHWLSPEFQTALLKELRSEIRKKRRSTFLAKINVMDNKPWKQEKAWSMWEVAECIFADQFIHWFFQDFFLFYEFSLPCGVKPSIKVSILVFVGIKISQQLFYLKKKKKSHILNIHTPPDGKALIWTICHQMPFRCDKYLHKQTSFYRKSS